MKNIINDLYITTCGRIFFKKSRYRTIKSFELIPSLNSTFKRFIKSNNLNASDFTRLDTGLKNNSGSKLYLYKYNVETPIYLEVFGAIDSDGYRMLTVNGRNFKWHRLVQYYFNNIDNYNEFQVNHIDGNKLNNCKINLEWSSPIDNIRHAWSTGLSAHSDDWCKRHSEKLLSKRGIDELFNENLNWSKYRIKRFLKPRCLDIDDFIFIETGIDVNDGNRKLGYLMKNV